MIDFRPRPTSIFAVVFTMLTSSIAPDATAAGANDEFAFGLDQLHWGVTLEEAKQLYPSSVQLGPLQPDKGYTGLALGVTSRGLPDPDVSYRYDDCAFSLRLNFYRNRLYQMVLTDIGNLVDNKCRNEIESELTTRFGPGIQTFARSGTFEAFSFGDWRKPATSVTYSVSNGFQASSITFGDAKDITGFHASELQASARDGQCESIAVAVTPGQNADGASAPILAPDVPDLGCEYPVLSYRLQEHGSVGLTIQVDADGTVGSVQIASPDRSLRLVEKAVELAKTKLHFIPSLRNGAPVDVVRQVDIVFKITNPIHGRP